MSVRSRSKKAAALLISLGLAPTGAPLSAVDLEDYRVALAAA